MSLLAEQVVVNCPPTTVEDVLTHRPADWLRPFLQLAGDAGEAAGRSVVPQPVAPPEPSTGVRTHTVRLGEPQRSGADLVVHMRWDTCQYQAMFRRFAGQLRVRPIDECSILSIEGSYEATPDLPAGDRALAARRAAEFAARSLLAQLRSALEHREDSPTG